MEPPARIFKEACALIVSISGVFVLFIGLGSWDDMTEDLRFYWMIFTPLSFIVASVLWWFSRRRRTRRKRR